MPARQPPAGIYVPILTFYKGDQQQEIDHETLTKHVQRLSAAGVQGITVHGTTGEPMFLSRAERLAVIKTVRKALDDVQSSCVMVVGCGVPSLWETKELIAEAAKAGTDFVMVIPPSTFAKAMTDEILYDFYKEIADTAAVPIQIYNFPGIANGLDLSLPLLQSLAPHPNIVGVKLSCGNVGKGACLSASFPQSQFAVLGGLADTLLHGLLASGSSGAVTGLANIAPRACVKVFDLFKEGKIEEARKAQHALSLAGGIELGGGIPGMRYGVIHYYGYGGSSRKPLPDANDALKAKVVEWLEPIMGNEEGLVKK